MNVLIVEDSIVSAAMIEARLQRKAPDMVIHIRKTLKGALEELKTFRVDLVVLDLGLPDSQPEETVLHIPKFKPAKILATSASTNPDLAKAALSNGADDFMPKCFGDSGELVDRMEALRPASPTAN
jgi:two-component system KDP operon response regulator KdpE